VVPLAICVVCQALNEFCGFATKKKIHHQRPVNEELLTKVPADML